MTIETTGQTNLIIKSNMNKPILQILLVALAALLFSGCRKNIVYSSFYPMESEKWHIDSVVKADYTIADTSSGYQILVYVRHTERYPYQNMWLFIGDSLHRDTIEFYLADDRGNWLGDKHHGFIEMPVLYEECRHYPDSGVYHLEIQQAMRDTMLRGITDIGVEVVMNNEK